MKKKLQILVVEDSEDDTQLEIHLIKKGGYDVYYKRVETAENMHKALKEKEWDIIISDYAMPHFNGMEALAILKESGLDIPFIIISGIIGEEVAVEVMKAGAHDYIMKNDMQRLLPALEREIRESKIRAERKLLEQKQKHAEALKISEEKLKNLVSDMHVGVLLLDSKGKIVLINNETLELLDLSQDQISGKCSIHPDWKIIYEDGLEFPGFPTLFQKIITDHQPIRNMMVEVYRPNKDTLAWLMIDALPKFDDNGNLQQVVWTFVDRTERKRAIEALRENEALYRSIILASPDNITITDLEGRILTVSPSAVQMFGYSKSDEFVGHPLTDFIVPDESNRLSSVIKHMHKKTKREPGEYRAVRKDGSIFDIEINAEFIKNLKEQPVKVIFVIRDITKRKLAETELRKLNKAIDQSPVSIIVTNSNGAIEYANPFTYNITGYKKEELLGKNPRIFKSGIIPDKVYKDLWKTIKSGNIWRGEFCNKKKNGDLYWEWANISPLFNNKGKITHFIAVKEDITERKRIETEIKLKNDELTRLNREKDKFFSIIAHDLKSPFSSFLGIIELLSKNISAFTEEQLQLVIADMKNSANSLYKLLENLLQWAKIEQGQFTFNPKLENLLKVANDSISTFSEAIKKKNINMANKIPENIMVSIDLNMFQTILRNFISNAIKFTPKGGNIEINAKTKKEKIVEISISDTGIGMDEDMVTNLFHLNARINRPGTEGEPSTGLGLLLCKEFIEKHSGKLWAKSKINVGTTFYFTVSRG